MDYLPPGWTAEQLAAATAEDLGALLYETLHLIKPTDVASPTARDMIFGARIDERNRRENVYFNRPEQLPRFKPGVPWPEDSHEDPRYREVAIIRRRQRLDREREVYMAKPTMDLGFETRKPQQPPSRPGGDPVVQAVERARFEDFGFIIMRLDYSDDKKWKEWCDKNAKAVDGYILENVQCGERIKDKVLFLLAEDKKELDGADWHGAVQYFKDLQSEKRIQPGLDLNIILAVDKSSLDSHFSPPSAETDDVPWTWALDVNFPFQRGEGSWHGQELPTDEYRGYFRVSTPEAVAEMYPMIMAGQSGDELWRPGVKVWQGDMFE